MSDILETSKNHNKSVDLSIKSTWGLGWKVHMKMSISAVDDFLTNEMQALQHWWKRCVNCKREGGGAILKNKPYLVTFHESIYFSTDPQIFTQTPLPQEGSDIRTRGWGIQSLPSPRLVVILWLKSSVCPTIYS